MALIIRFTDQDIEKFIINSPQKAYTLGFLWGDGHLKHFNNKNGISDIRYISLEIVRDDLDPIKEFFNDWGTWNISYRTRKNRREIGNIISFDRNFGYFLTKNNYDIKSSAEPTKILSIISDELKMYWWRGFIDADGCFYHKNKSHQFSIAGAFGVSWQETINLFTKLDIIKYQVQQRIHKKSKSSAIRISNKNDIIKLGNYIYNDKISIGLKRKYDKYCLLTK